MLQNCSRLEIISRSVFRTHLMPHPPLPFSFSLLITWTLDYEGFNPLKHVRRRRRLRRRRGEEEEAITGIYWCPLVTKLKTISDKKFRPILIKKSSHLSIKKTVQSIFGVKIRRSFSSSKTKKNLDFQTFFLFL